VREIAPQDDDIVILKDKPSVFFGTPLMSYLHELQVDTLLVAGTTTSGCAGNCRDAFSLTLGWWSSRTASSIEDGLAQGQPI
jgi:nicotinamidase-related amidase